MLNTVHVILQRAAADAKAAQEFNSSKTPHMRISRAGQPLVSILLEDFIFPRLPVLPKKTLTEKAQNAETIKRVMAQSLGYIFEQSVIDIICTNQSLKVLPQYNVDLGFIKGTADIVVVNEASSTVSVVECKALKYGTKKEACSLALFNDSSTGYLSQLTLYKSAVQEDFKAYSVNSYWMLFCKETASTFKIDLSESGVDEVALVDGVKLKCDYYELYKSAQDEKDFSKCLDMLDLKTLPLKTPMYSYFMSSCSAHYNPWMSLLVDESGVPWDEAIDHLSLMLKVSLHDDAEAKSTLLEII